MIKIDPAILVILGEVFVGLVVILIAVLVYFIKRRKSDKQAVEALQARLKDNSGKRQEQFEDVLADPGDAEAGNDAIIAEKKEIAQGWVEKENKFYNRLVEMYMQRNSSALVSLDKLLHDYTSSYLDVVKLMRERMGSGKAELAEEFGQQLERLEEGGQRLAAEVESLKVENQRLSADLERAYAEIDHAMQEYTKTFRSDDELVMADEVIESIIQNSGNTQTDPDDVVASTKAASEAEQAEVVVSSEETPEPEVVQESISETSEPVSEQEPVAVSESVPESESEESAPETDTDTESVSEDEVINLAIEEEEPHLPDDEASPEPEDDELLGDVLPESADADDQIDVDIDDIDADALLAQLDSIDEDEDFIGELEKLGEIPAAPDEAETKK